MIWKLVRSAEDVSLCGTVYVHEGRAATSTLSSRSTHKLIPDMLWLTKNRVTFFADPTKNGYNFDSVSYTHLRAHET